MKTGGVSETLRAAARPYVFAKRHAMKIFGSLFLSIIILCSFACSDDTVPGSDGGGTKDLKISVEAGGDMMQPDMPTADLAQPDLSQPDASSSSCPSGGKKLTPSGSGTCADPYKVDLSGTKVGDVVYVEVAGTVGADEKQFTKSSNCNPKTTARDIVFALVLPSSGNSGVWVSADASPGADPIATMLEDTSCGQPANACSDVNGKDKEECLLAKKGGSGYGSNKPYAVVSEVVHSGKALTVRFKMVL